MRPLLSVLTALLTVIALAAPRETVMLWPDGKMPHDDGVRYTEAEMARDSTVNSPVMYIYPANTPVDLVVIACPGGGYDHLAINHEGHDFAQWFNRQGINFAMLQYRMPRGNGLAPLSDVARAIEIARERFPGAKVGLMGFSAGGHLVGVASTTLTDRARPDFQILFYPVTRLTNGDFMDRRFCGENAPAEMTARYSCVEQVGPATPPAILFHAADDPLVATDHSIDYFKALRSNGVPAALHIYPTGGHGWGFLDIYTYKPLWTAELEQWLKTL